MTFPGRPLYCFFEAALLPVLFGKSVLGTYSCMLQECISLQVK